MKKRSIVLLIIGLILIVLPFIFNEYNLLRFISIIVGIFIVTLGVALNKKNHIVLVIVTPLIVFAITYAFDMLFFYTFNRLPIYVYEIKSSDTVRNYNSLFYRLYSCDSNLIMDYGYHMNFPCNIDSLKTVDINEILSDPQESFKKYKEKYVRVHGKISKIVNVDRIELSPYDNDSLKINGYVTFNFNYRLIVPVKNDVNDLRIYDEIDVIGKISGLKDDATSLVMSDTILVTSNIYDKWNYEIVNNSDKTFENITDSYYFYGISELNVKFTDNNIYELKYLINDKQISIDDILNNVSTSNKYTNEDNTLVGEEYILGKFKVLKCSNDKIIIANKKLKLNVNTCLMDK